MQDLETIHGPTYAVSTWLFLRGLGVIYIIAFLSLAVQIKGLIGTAGLMPIGAYLRSTRDLWGSSRFLEFPTFCWWKSSDSFLQGMCYGGALLGGLLVLGVAPVFLLALLYLLYLSLTTAGRVFLSFQWDVLLLETGFLAIWLAPVEWWSGWVPEEDPSPLARWLIYWLLFRLMFFSGYVKLRNGDPTWRKLTTLQFHYETQPLPTPWAWHVHQFPAGFHKASCAVMFAIELIAPFGIFLPPPYPCFTALATIVLMVLIMGTGNYCFFNWLTILLCLPLLEDGIWRMAGAKLGLASGWVQSTAEGRWPLWWLAPLAFFLFALSFFRLIPQWRPGLFGAGLLDRWVDFLAPFRLVNRYGLFSVMTTSRLEIIVEGSNDGQAWMAYEFKWKPGQPSRRPPWVQPHQPRLDWQMWFAALSHHSAHRWFQVFLLRLLEGRPETLKLIQTNPFPSRPPRFVRATLYRYQFAPRATRRQTGAWWVRERIGPYGPVLPQQEGTSTRGDFRND